MSEPVWRVSAGYKLASSLVRLKKYTDAHGLSKEHINDLVLGVAMTSRHIFKSTSIQSVVSCIANIIQQEWQANDDFLSSRVRFRIPLGFHISPR